MKSNIVLFLICTLLIMKNIHSQSEPKALITPKKLTKHKHERIDNYYWMNLRDSKEVLDYIKEENKNTENYFKPLTSLQNKLLAEFENRIDPNDVGAPFRYQGKTYQQKNIADKDYQITFVIENNVEKVFFDENERAEKSSFYDLADWSLSPNNKTLAFSEDFIGRRKYEIRFRDEATNKIYKETIKDTDGSLVWANDNLTLFYVKKDQTTLREFQVYKHIFGTNSTKDVLVYEEKDERFAVSISKTIDSKYIVITSQSSITNEQLYIDANLPTEIPKAFFTRKDGHLYNVDSHNGDFFVLSNLNASNNQILHFSKLPDNIEEGEIIIAHNPKILIEDFLTLKNHLIFQTRENGLQEINILNLNTKSSYQIQIKEETYTLELGYNQDFEAEEIFYNYSSMTTPNSVYQFNLSKQTSNLFFQRKLIDPNFNSINYESKRIWATANDGTQIPISLVYKKGIDLKNAPLLLYGYGSYGVTIPASFSAVRLSLLDRGFVYAIAHIRGGKYLGEEWYENGKLFKKKNTFTDFINCAEYLAIKGFCHKDKIYAQGGSAGGLLMGAVMNMAPYLWKGIIAQVPFVDVVTTMLDETLPLTVGEYEEWGNPNKEDVYYYLLNYSPYDNVRAINYPALLVTTGYHDSQVQYWEPLKWVAKIRALRTNNTPLIFDCNLDAGHGGGSGRSSERTEIAKAFSFILNLEGIE